jgi:phenylalanyl-tRNA synthetase beta chain
MKLSWNWMSELVDMTSVGTPEKLAELLTARGLEVEEIIRQDQGLNHVVTGHIVEKGQHPQSDRLSYCQVDAGTGQILNIVCGAQNHKTGDKVVVALIGADLPNGLKIGKSKIRGVESEGMLCSESELGLKSESEGILILPPETTIGQPIAKFLGKTDVTLVLKLYANQGHLLSHVGVAREVAAHLSLQASSRGTEKKPENFFSPHRLKHLQETALFSGEKNPIEITLEAGESAPQFIGLSIEGVKVGASPSWVVQRLESLGSRSINNVVDATNLVLFELGHPVHAYDQKNLLGKKIRVREASGGEKLPLLDGTEITLSGKELVIGDAERAIGLAGVMGGGNTEVTESTTNVYLECAQFDPILVRQSKVRYQKLTEAATRFEKGVDPEGLEFVMRRLAALVIELGGGKIVGGHHAKRSIASRPTITLKSDFIPGFLGMNEASARTLDVLSSLDCKVVPAGDSITVTPPSYRLDLRLKQDLAEEVARSIGYDQIPSTVPPLTTAPKPRENGDAILLARAKDALIRNGLSEALNYSFTSLATLQMFGLKSRVKLLNPLSEEFEVMVPSLLPGLLSNAQNGFRKHFGSESLNLKLFEIRPTFHHEGTEIRAVSQTETGVQENWKCSFVMTGERFGEALRKEAGEIDFYDLKAMALNFFEVMGTKGVRWIRLGESRTQRNENQSAIAALFHPGVSAEILLGNESLGIVGKLHPKVAKALKLRQDVYLGEWDWKALTKMSRAPYQAKTYTAWGETPPMERDFAFVVDEKVTADQMISAVMKASKPLAKTVKVFDVYRGAPVPEGKASVAIRVILQDKDRSLQEAEVEPISKAIIAALQKECGAELR